MTSQTSNKEYSTPKSVESTTLFHRLLVGLDKTSYWPGWSVYLIAMAASVLAGAAWLLAVGRPSWAAVAAVLLFAFILSDNLIFVALPLFSISFGSWKSQLLIMSLPRLLVALGAGLVTGITTPELGLVLMAAAELAITSLLIWGSMFEVRLLKLSQIRVQSELLPDGAEPINILHISDIHIERLTAREEKLLELVKLAAPDFIVLTGDYLNLSYVQDQDAHSEIKELLGRLSAPGGVYAVLGGPTVDDREVVPGLFNDLPVRLLIDEWVELDATGKGKIVLLGLDCTQDRSIDSDSLERLVDSSPNGVPRILLYHTPDLMPLAAELGIDLYLCGHTHGGQIRIPFYGALLTSSKYGKRYEMGLYKEGNTVLYVSRGVGLEGLVAPRMRLLAPPEISQILIEGTG